MDRRRSLARLCLALLLAAPATGVVAGCAATCEDACTALGQCQGSVDPKAKVFSIHLNCQAECDAEPCDNADARQNWLDCLDDIDCDDAASAADEIKACGRTCHADGAAAASGVPVVQVQ